MRKGTELTLSLIYFSSSDDEDNSNTNEIVIPEVLADVRQNFQKYSF